MADTEAPEHPAESLEPILGHVLKETGKFFRALESRDSRRIGNVKAAIAQAIPAANQRFHEILDDIETEIIKAKSVFERDLSSIRAKRAARERAAAGALRPKTPNDVVKKSTPNCTSEKEDATTGQPSEDQPEDINGIGDITDIPMTEELAGINCLKSSPKEAGTITDTIKTEPFSIPQDLPEDPKQPKGLAISLDQPPTPPTSVPPNLKPENADHLPPDDQPPQQSPNADLQDAEFESMFNDTDLPDTTPDLNFDLNFSTEDVNGSSDLLDASAFQNISLPNGDANGHMANSTANEDLTTLLPGLENYVNGSNDFSTADMPDISSDFLNISGNGTNDNISAVTNTAGDGTTTQALAEPPAPIESSFEDMFALDSYMNGTGDDELGGTGNMGEVGEFDDNWFKTDGI
ncbi:MAG: hypothetical protein Q9225_005009 [Loekoesia sp. 1 TL-2023]